MTFLFLRFANDKIHQTFYTIPCEIPAPRAKIMTIAPKPTEHQRDRLANDRLIMGKQISGAQNSIKPNKKLTKRRLPSISIMKTA